MAADYTIDAVREAVEELRLLNQFLVLVKRGNPGSENSELSRIIDGVDHIISEYPKTPYAISDMSCH